MKNYLTKLILITYLISSFLIFLNLTRRDNPELSNSITAPDLSDMDYDFDLSPNIDYDYLLNLEDQLALTIPLDRIKSYLINPQLRDAINSRRKKLKQKNILIEADSQVIKLGECSNGKPRRKWVFGVEETYYNLNLSPQNIKLATISGQTNKIKITIDAEDAIITSGIFYKKFRCGTKRKDKNLSVQMRGLSLSAELELDIDQINGITIKSFMNEKLEYIGRPHISGSATILSELSSFLSERFFNSLNCDTSEQCVINYVLPIIENFFDWDSKFNQLLVDGFEKLNEELTKPQRFRVPRLGLKSKLNFNKMKFFDQKLWALYDLTGSIKGNYHSCASDFTAIEPNSGLIGSYKDGFFVGNSTLEGLINSLVAGGSACKSSTVPAGVIPGISHETIFKIYPQGSLSFGLSSFNYDKEIFKYKKIPLGPPHDPQKPITPNYKLDSKTDDGEGSASTFEIQVPIKIRFPNEPSLSSTLSGVARINIDFTTPINQQMNSDGYHLSIKEVQLISLTGTLVTPTASIPGALAMPLMNEELKKNRERRIEKRMFPPCNNGFSEEDYYYIAPGEDIYFDTYTFFIRDCSTCNTFLNFDPTIMGMPVISKFIKNINYSANYFEIKSDPYAPKGYSFSQDKDCPITLEQKEDLDEAIEENERKLNEKFFGQGNDRRNNGAPNEEFENDTPIPDRILPGP